MWPVPQNGVGRLSTDYVGDLQSLLGKVQQITDELPATLKAVPQMQDDIHFVRSAVPILIGSLLILAVAIVVTK